MSKAPTKKMKRNLYFIVFGLFFGFLIVWNIIHLVKYSIVENEQFQALANDSQFGSTTVTAKRGSIYDANGQIFAQSATVYSIIVDPYKLSKLNNDTVDPDTGKTEYQRQYEALTKILTEELAITREDVDKALENENLQWSLVTKNVQKPTADKILKRADAAGLAYNLIYTNTDTKRFYPQGSLAASVIGFTNFEGDGVYGVESYYNDYLKGVNGKIISATDGKGQEMPYKNDKIYDAQDGSDVYLTIDRTLQHYAEKHLDQAIKDNNVQNRGCAIIMNVNTGAILAMASSPGYDLNDRNAIYAQKDIDLLAGITDEEEYNAQYAALREQQWKNKAITELYFPGSVFKVVTGAAALEEGAITLDSTFHCSQVIQVADTPIHCWARYSHGSQDFTTAMTNSCNPAFILIGQALGGTAFSKYFEAFGLTEPTGIDLPGEADSIYVHAENMGPVELASCSFGQSNKITPIQMITAYAATINGGYLVTPHVVSKVVDPNGNVVKTADTSVKRQVISEETSAEMRKVLEDVVNTKGGSNAYIKGYAIGGKSGTSEKIDKYNETGIEDLYVSSYCGFAPADDPEIIMLVMIDEPTALDQNGSLMYYGSVVACPVVSNTFKEALPYLGYYPEYTDEELEAMGISVPSVVGHTVASAQSTLEKLGLESEVAGDGTNIVAQVPEQGNTMRHGGKVILYTSEETEHKLVTVPNVKGMSISDVNTALTNAGLNFKAGDGASSHAGSVAYTQSIAEGTPVERGTIVEVTFMIKDEG